MVEFAVILPVLAMLVVGVVEIGFAFKEKLLVDNAIQVAARTGSALGVR
jgi:Flp pilus assembly protein TadG